QPLTADDRDRALVRAGERPGGARRALPRDDRGARHRREPLAPGAGRDALRALRPPAARRLPGHRGHEVRDARPYRLARRSLAPRRSERYRQEPPRPARAEAARPLPPHRRRRRPPGDRDRRRGARPLTAELARAGGLVGCVGLAALLVAPTRVLRLAALAAWALGALGLAVYLLP